MYIYIYIRVIYVYVCVYIYIYIYIAFHLQHVVVDFHEVVAGACCRGAVVLVLVVRPRGAGRSLRAERSLRGAGRSLLAPAVLGATL